MKKLLTLLLVLTLTLATFTSCFLFGGGDNTGDGGSGSGNTGDGGSGDGGSGSGNTGDGGSDNVGKGEFEGWIKGDTIYYRGDSEVPAENLQKRFAVATNIALSHTPDAGSKFFIIGEYDHAVSKMAYAALERYFSGDDENNTIYVIYNDGTSVAIAYNSLVARYAAIEYFLTNFKSIDLTTAGVVAYKEFNTASYVDETREALRAEGMAEAGKILSDAAINELKVLYGLYDEQVYYWLANLYDPEIGAFYYSGSARDTQGFLPDLESTAEALIFMADSGMLSEYEGKFKDALPEEVKTAILNWTKGLQSSENGYFYHPQWGDDITNNRLGRDLGWAKRIINGFGARPFWTTPDGFGGENGKPGTAATASALTGRLGSGSVAAAVSKVIPTAAPAYLSSVDAFITHLEKDYNWDTNSYAAGNAIESDLGQIIAKGKTYTDALINFLNSKQKSNGLWENTVDKDSVNGFMKISGVYTSLGVSIPKAEEAMKSVTTMLTSTDRPDHVCTVYNAWESVANLLITIENKAGKEEADRLRVTFREDAANLIKITCDKIKLFEKDDGGFSYYIKYSAARSQGVVVCVDKMAESDVNATNICTNSLINAMFDVFGIDQVERYYPVDFAYFSDMLVDLGAIVKDKVLKAEHATFDEYDAALGNEVGGVVTYPSDYSENIVGDFDSLDSETYKWFQSSVVQNPDPTAAVGDLVLYAKNFVDPTGTKQLADKPSSTVFTMANAGIDSLANCYVYDADMYFVSGYLLEDGTKYEYGKKNSSGAATSDPLIQLTFKTESLPCAQLNFNVYTENGKNYIKIGESYAGMDGKNNGVAGGIPMDEWVHLTIEYYKDYEVKEDGTTGAYQPKMKIFVNGTYWGECDATITGADKTGATNYYDRKIDRVAISYYRFLSSEIYFNNVTVDNCRKEYVKEININAVVDPALPQEDMREVANFEDGLLNTSNVANKIRVLHFGTSKYVNATAGQTFNPKISYSIAADPKDSTNNVLKVIALSDKNKDYADKPSRTEVNMYNAAANGTDYTFSGDFYYEHVQVKGTATQLAFLDTKDNQLYLMGINAAPRTDGENGLMITLVSSNGTTAEIATEIPMNSWFNLKVVFHRGGTAETTSADIYLNGEKIYTDNTYKATAVSASDPTAKVAIIHQMTNNVTLYLDDLSLVRSGEIVEATESEDKVADFEEGYNTKYVHSFSYNGSTELAVTDIDDVLMSSLYTKYSLHKDPVDEANTCLRAVNKNGGSKAGYTKVDISNDNPEGNCYTFETRMYLETYSAGYNLTQRQFIDKNGAVAFNAYTSVDKTSGNFKIATTGSGTFPAAGTSLLDGSLAVKPKTWFTLRIEFYNAGASATTSNTYMKIYIKYTPAVEEGETPVEVEALAYDGLAYATLGAEISHVNLIHVKTTKSSAVLFDDISLTRTNKAYAQGK